MLVDSLTGAPPTPTPPVTERPVAASGVPGGAPAAPTAPVIAPPVSAHDDLPYADVLDRVHELWSNALDEPAQPAAPPAAAATPFGDHLRTASAMDAVKPVVEQVAAQHGIPAPVGLALVSTISQGNPDAELAGGQAVGLAGVPLHQFAPDQNPKDPTTNLSTAFGRLKELHGETGDWSKAALRLFGASDRAGNPRTLAPGVDGHGFLSQFEAARARFGGT